MKAAQVVRSLFLSVACLVIVAACGLDASATNVNVEMCDSTSGPIIALATPASDSIVNTAIVRVEGTSIRTTQIDISLNGEYSSSLAIGPSGHVDTTVTLAKGTNTINLRAYYSCNQTNTTKTIVVTYEPTAVPSDGSSIITILPSVPALFTLPGSLPHGSLPSEKADSPNPGTANPSQPNKAGAGSDEQTPATPKPPTGTSWVPIALVATSLVAPSLLLLSFERLASPFGFAALLHLAVAAKWLIRGSGLLLAGLLAALLFGGGYA